MKGKKDLIDKAEILIDPITIKSKLPSIKEQLKKTTDYTKYLANSLSSLELKVDRDLRVDTNINKKSTLLALKKHLDNLMKEFTFINTLDSTVRERVYNIIYNSTISVFYKCQRIRNAGFAYHSVKYLAWIITLLENNVILSGLKFLKWRMKCYVELALCFEDIKAYKSSFKVIGQAITKLGVLKNVEEQQQLLSGYISTTLIYNLRIMKSLELKYGLLVSIISNINLYIIIILL